MPTPPSDPSNVLERSSQSLNPGVQVPSVSAWTPPAEARLHNGDPISPGMDFFEPPPQEIGPILTAYSTLQVGQSGSSRPQELMIAAAVAVGVGVLWSLTALGDPSPTWGQALRMGLTAVALAGLPLGLIVMLLLRFHHTVSYVGQFGVARTIIRQRGHIHRQERFLFADAVDLYVWLVKQAGGNTGLRTEYAFTWKDVQGRRVYSLSGSYRGHGDRPKASSSYHLGRSAEAVWTRLLWEVLADELKTDGSILFRVNENDAVRVGQGFIDLQFGQRHQRMAVDEIGKFHLSGDTFHVQHKDAHPFNGEGVYQFKRSRLANARVFLICLERLCGLQLE